MEKFKLIETRTKKGYTQQQIADKLHIDVSNYNRREKGIIKISHKESEKLSNILQVQIEDIYENEEKNYFVCKDNASGNYQGTNHIYTILEYFLENQRKYILKLEEEIAQLKAQLGEK